MKSNLPSTVTLPEYLRQYILGHMPCICGQCPKPENPVVDLVLLKFEIKPGADAESLRLLIKDHKGEFCECDPLDGKEHGFIELGAWLGSQEAALGMMGLGEHLGLWKLLTPTRVLGKDLPPILAKVMAGSGLLTIIAHKNEHTR